MLHAAQAQMKTAARHGGRTMRHQKCLVVDSSSCLIGSANMTQNSRVHAFEFGVYITQRRTVIGCEDKFEYLWSKGSPITSDLIEAWRAREAAHPQRAVST